MPELTLPDKHWVRASFERAAERYDEAAQLQREVCSRLVERLDYIKLAPQRILDLGTGTGFGAAALDRRYPKASLVALDLAEAMVQRTRERFGWWRRRRHAFLCADAERLPLADGCCDLIFSNLTVQWCGNLEGTFQEFRRVLRPGGLLMFTTFGPDTLKELRAAWAAVDGGVHVNNFLDMHDVGDALVRARLADPVMDVENITVTYREATELMRDLKTIGAHNVNSGRGTGMTGRQRLAAVVEAYEPFRREGLLPATYEIIYGHAWAPEGPSVQKDDGGEVRIPLDQLGHRR